MENFLIQLVKDGVFVSIAGCILLATFVGFAVFGVGMGYFLLFFFGLGILGLAFNN